MSKSVSPPPSPKIFISYRRDDSAGHAGRLFDRLSAHFGADQIFMDIEQIEAGVDFVQAIQDAVGSCEILVVLIGKNWLASRDEAGRRLDNPNDFVRVEIAAALERDVRVIPVLLQGATMPRPQDLPEDMSALSRRNAIELSDTRWKYDVDGLIAALEKVLDRQREAQRRAEEAAAERQRLETEARQREAAAAEAQRREAEARETQRREAEEPPEAKGAAHLGTAGEVKEAALHEDQEGRRTQEKEGQAARRADERMDDERRGRARQGQVVREEVERKQKTKVAAGRRFGTAEALVIPVVVVLLFISAFTLWPKRTIPPATNSNGPVTTPTAANLTAPAATPIAANSAAPAATPSGTTANKPAFLFCYQYYDGPDVKYSYWVLCFTSQALCGKNRREDLMKKFKSTACERVDMSHVPSWKGPEDNIEGVTWSDNQAEPFGEPFPKIRK
jgi:hypothetical protein